MYTTIIFVENTQITPNKSNYIVNKTKNNQLKAPLSIKEALNLPTAPQLDGLKAIAQDNFANLHLPSLANVKDPTSLKGSSLQIYRDVSCTAYIPVGGARNISSSSS